MHEGCSLSRGFFTIPLALALLAASGGKSGRAAEPTELADQKLVMSFETAQEVEELKGAAENVVLDIVADYCVTWGQNCIRVVGKMGQPWASISITNPALLKDFEKFDYLGLDVHSESSASFKLTLELWDKDTVDYYTRATLDAKDIRNGMNHLFWRINRAKRNNKEGREWNELEAKDKIDRANLTRVKLFFVPLKEGGDTKLWMDKLRLMPENAVGGKTEVTLPPKAIGYKFGSSFYCPKGFQHIGLIETGPGLAPDAKDCIGTGIGEIGKDWPDTLTGNGLYCSQGDFTFEATNVPPGEYWVWLSAGKVFNREMLKNLPFLLKVGDQTLVNERLSEPDYFGEKGIFRYIRTQYSERPDALWLDYALPEAEEFTFKVKATDSPLTVKVTSMRLAAMVLMPANEESAFKKMCADFRQARLKYFNEKTFRKLPAKPKAPSGVGAYTLWMPKPHETVSPWSAPTEEQRKAVEFKWRGAQGERISQRICVTAWEDLGMGDLELSDFQGPAVIPANAIRKYYMNYRFQDASAGEMALLPWTKIRFEPKITWAYWLWMKIPDDAAPGDYTAIATFKPDKGGEKKIPIKLTVHPFKLEEILPVAYGMYYWAWNFNPTTAPKGYKNPGEFMLGLMKDQFKFMREIGFTTTVLQAPFIHEWNLRGETADPYWQAAKNAGLGRHPDQRIMTAQLGLARRIARDMFFDIDPKKYGMEYNDRNPGTEFTLPDFRVKLLDYLGRFRQWTEKYQLPIAMEVIDEPREVPNPWNRRRDETIRYADWVKEAGFTNFVTFIADFNGNKDYTPIVDHIDIVSVHAWDASKKLIAKARAQKKTLWFYNTGMDRLSWGFYNWAMDSKGRWEWHFCAPDAGGVDGHPNTLEWYTPFTSLAGYANHAPYFDPAFPGGMTFKSVFFQVEEGITDYAYIYTLEKAIEAAAADPAKAKPVEEAKTFLAAVKKAIPEYPGIRNMANADSGALVGAGFDTPVAHMTDLWRGRIAELLIKLKGK